MRLQELKNKTLALHFSLTFSLLNVDLSFFENSVDPDQLAFEERCFPLWLNIQMYMYTTRLLHVNTLKSGRSVVHKNIQHDKG